MSAMEAHSSFGLNEYEDWRLWLVVVRVESFMIDGIVRCVYSRIW